MKRTIRLHVESMCRTDYLGMEFDLDTNPELEAAILVINDACSDKVKNIKKHLRDEFLAKKYHELRENIQNGQVSRLILNEIADYEKKT